MSRRSSIPWVLNIILFSGVILLAWLKLQDWQGWALYLATGVVFTYLSWILWEARTSRRDSRQRSVRSDRWTFEVYALAQGGTALSALLLHSQWPFERALFLIGGAVIFGCGVTLRTLAVRELKDFYSHRVHLADGHAVITTGPYRVLRHPAYAGMLLAHLGFVMVFFNWVSLTLLLGALLPAIVRRIRVEEEALAGLPEYLRSFRGRSRLMPRVW